MEFAIISRNRNYWPFLLSDHTIRIILSYIKSEDFINIDDADFELNYKPNLGRLGDDWLEASYDEYYQIIDFYTSYRNSEQYHSLKVLYIKNGICYCRMGNTKYCSEWLDTYTYFSVDIANFVRIFSSREYTYNTLNIYKILKNALKI